MGLEGRWAQIGYIYINIILLSQVILSIYEGIMIDTYLTVYFQKFPMRLIKTKFDILFKYILLHVQVGLLIKNNCGICRLKFELHSCLLVSAKTTRNLHRKKNNYFENYNCKL